MTKRTLTYEGMPLQQRRSVSERTLKGTSRRHKLASQRKTFRRHNNNVL